MAKVPTPPEPPWIRTRLPGFSCALSSACSRPASAGVAARMCPRGCCSASCSQLARQHKWAQMAALSEPHKQALAAGAHAWNAVRDTRGTAPSSLLRERLLGAGASHSSGTATWVAKVPVLNNALQLCGSAWSCEPSDQEADEHLRSRRGGSSRSVQRLHLPEKTAHRTI